VTELNHETPLEKISLKVFFLKKTQEIHVRFDGVAYICIKFQVQTSFFESTEQGNNAFAPFFLFLYNLSNLYFLKVKVSLICI